MTLLTIIICIVIALCLIAMGRGLLDIGKAPYYDPDKEYKAGDTMKPRADIEYDRRDWEYEGVGVYIFRPWELE